MTEFKPYIGNHERGLPSKIFDQGFTEGLVEGLSGNPLWCAVSSRSIRVSTEPGFTRTIYYAGVDDSGKLSMIIRTRDPQTQELLAPDLFAGQLTRRFFQHVTANGIEVQTIEGSWSSTSNNYKEFTKHVAETADMKNITPKDEIESAKNTWTGRLAISLGYEETKILNEWRTDESVLVEFTKPTRRS